MYRLHNCYGTYVCSGYTNVMVPMHVLCTLAVMVGMHAPCVKNLENFELCLLLTCILSTFHLTPISHCGWQSCRARSSISDLHVSRSLVSSPYLNRCSWIVSCHLCLCLPPHPFHLSYILFVSCRRARLYHWSCFAFIPLLVDI